MNKRILHLAVPNIISNLSVPLLGIVDTALVGHLEHVYYLGALAVGSVIFNFVFWGFGFLRMGTTGLTAQELGRSNNQEIMMILARVTGLSLVLGLAIILLQHPIAELSLFLIDSTDEVANYTRVYYDIRIYTAPAVLLTYGITGWFLGMQNARDPMIIAVFLNILNLLLNVLFIHVFDMHVNGVAYGTLISSYLSVILALYLFFRKYRKYLKFYEKSTLFDPEKLKRYFSVNRDIFIRTLCLMITFTYFTAASAAQGEIVLAANTILLQFWYTLSYGIDGFAYAAESLIGKYTGSREVGKLKRAVKLTLIWGMGIGVAGTLIYGVAGDQLLHLFTDNQEVIAHARSVLIWTVLAPAAASACYVLDGIFIGATHTVPMRNSMIIATFAIFFPAYYLFTSLYGVHGLWLAMLLFMILRGITLGLYLPFTVLKLEK